MTIITVSYSAGESFNLDYYVDTHMPLVWSRWGSMGLSDFRVMKGVPGVDGSPAAIQITVALTFSSADALAAAAQAYGQEIFGDVPNFTQAKPVVQLYEYFK